MWQWYGIRDRIKPTLKGQSNEIFYLWFFHWWNPLKPLSRFLMTFQIWLRIRWDIHDFWSTLRCNLKWRVDIPCIVYYGRVVTLRITLAGSHHLLALSAQTLACRLIQRVITPRIDYYGESLLPASFTAGSHCWQRRVNFKNFEGFPLPLKGQWSKKWTIHVEYCSPRIFQKSKKYGLPKALFLTLRCNWQRGVDFLII